jgi:SAM-dependent methyltransferase
VPRSDVLAAEDQSRRYGREFGEIYDLVFPPAPEAGQAAALLHRLAGGGAPEVVELGVGSGRVAVPLARLGARVVGVDTSPELLARARSRAGAEGLDVRLVEADLRTWRSPRPVDLVYCVCGTLSMLATPEEQAAALAGAAASTRPGGAVVVETHSPERVRRLHARQDRVSVHADVPDLPGGLTTLSVLAPGSLRWRVEHTWSLDGRPRTAQEFSTLTDADRLDAMAATAGLQPERRASDWTGAPYEPYCPMYVCVYRVPDPAA